MIKDIFARYEVLVQSKNNADSVCSKLNAEFQGCFYRNKGDVWAAFSEDGKQKVQKLGTFA
jgi:hypothetical protein